MAKEVVRMSNKEMNKVAIRIITKIESLKDVRGPDVALFINVTKEDGLVYQGMVDDWSQELIDENRLIDFENMIDNMYGTGVWE
jgi:hypothetical protein